MEDGHADVLNLFKSLPLVQQTAIYPQISAAFNASKDARRLQLEAEIRALGFSQERQRKSRNASRNTGDQTGEVWSGVGAMASLLLKLKEAGESIENYRVDGSLR
jgi:DNA-binding protein H-NS